MGLTVWALACGGGSVAEFREAGIYLENFVGQGETILCRARELTPLFFCKAAFEAKAIG